LLRHNINTELKGESENPNSHDLEHNAARIGGDLAALRHRLNNNSPPADPSDWALQHIFPRKDDGTAQLEIVTPTTSKE